MRRQCPRRFRRSPRASPGMADGWYIHRRRPAKCTSSRPCHATQRRDELVRRAEGARADEIAMALTAGTRLGPYEIVALLGAGGMGEVYRARDTKLDREVAIKVLPEAFVSDPERVARFQREAKTLAALNHPHIAHIYGLEGRDGQDAPAFIVMELVVG